MNEIHQKFKYKGMMVLGQNCWEQDESAATDFVKQTKLAYPVALDNQDRSMAKDWMSAAGRSSLPAAFVVDKKGILAWIGDPAELNEQIITDILAGSYEVKPPTQRPPQKDPLAAKEELLNNLIAQLGSNSTQTATAFVQRAEIRARSQHWKEAASDLKQAIQINPAEPWPWYILTPLLLQTGDFAEYRKHSHEILVRFGQTDNAIVACRAAEGCLLSTQASTNDVEVSAPILQRKKFPHWRRFYIGLSEYRFGRFSNAADWMEQIRNNLDSINGVDRLPCEADACLLLAMARHQLNQPEKAREALDHAKEIIDTGMPKFGGPDLGGHWWNVLTTHILAKEAMELVDEAAEAPPGPQR